MEVHDGVQIRVIWQRWSILIQFSPPSCQGGEIAQKGVNFAKGGEIAKTPSSRSDRRGFYRTATFALFVVFGVRFSVFSGGNNAPARDVFALSFG